MTVSANAKRFSADAPAYAALQAEFKGDLVLPEHPDYAEAIKRWASTSERKAGLVAFVKDEEDVSKVVKYAVAEGLELAIRCGGHSVSSSSSTDGGIVVDMSRYFRTVKVDTEKKVAYVGGGALWMDVDKAAIQHSLATVGGTVSHTGVAGLVLGGGYGYLSGQHGLAIDNLLGARMVLADGSIVHCDETENKDLHWAIRGGGCNFGVVTQFDLRLHDQTPTVYGGILVFQPDRISAVLEAADKWENEDLCERSAGQLAFLKIPNLGPAIAMICFYNGTEEEGRHNFRHFLAAGPMMDRTGTMPYEQTNEQIIAPHGRSTYMTSGTMIQPTIATGAQVWAKYMEICTAHPEFEWVNVVFMFFPHFAFRKVSTDATAFACRGTKASVMTELQWAGEGAEKVDTQLPKKLCKEILDLIHGVTAELETPYANFETEGAIGSDKVQKLFGPNYTRLQQLKAKYDPDLIFSKWFPIQPAKQAA